MSEHRYGHGKVPRTHELVNKLVHDAVARGTPSSSRTVSVVHNATATVKAASTRTVGKNYSATAKGNAKWESVGGQRVKEFIERSPIWIAVSFVIALLFWGLDQYQLVLGPWGLLASLIFVVAAWLVDWIPGRRAERTVREIRERG